jgi:hypothetical protein
VIDEAVYLPEFWLEMSIIFSDITPYDRAVLEPTLHFFFDKNNCDEKADVLVKRANLSRQEAVERVRCGCSEKKKYGETEDYEYWTCPCRIIDRSLATLVSIAQHMKNGILPFEGGYCDQPAGLMSAMGIVQTFLAKQEERERKANEAKGKSKKGRR